MARTAITVNSVSGPYQAATALSGVSGDSANDHEIDMAHAPRLNLIVVNTGANSIDFTIALNDFLTYGRGNLQRTNTVGANEYRCIPLDMPPDGRQAGNTLHITSADANFADLTFYAYTWNPYPRVGR